MDTSGAFIVVLPKVIVTPVKLIVKGDVRWLGSKPGRLKTLLNQI